MANIKFSAFTQKAVVGDVDFLVGYTGADNVRVAPSVFDNVYLPLAGGTMTGDIVFNDNIKARFGTGLDAYIEHDGTDTYIVNATGSLDVRAASNFVIKNNAGSENVLIATPNGAVKLYYDAAKKLETTSAGATLTGALSITGDGSNAATLTESGAGLLTIATVDDFVVDCASDITLDAAGNDIRFFKAGVEYGKFKEDSGGFAIYASQENEDIIFRGNDGGSVINALTLDMSEAGDAAFNRHVQLPDEGQVQCGNLSGGDLKLYHFPSIASYVLNKTDDLRIVNQANDKDIIFETDDGAGSTTAYITLDGSATNIAINKNTIHPDSVYTYWGDANDFYIGHDSTDTNLINSTGHLYISNYSDDKDIYFQTDDGAGSIRTYMYLDGSEAAAGDACWTIWPDNSRIGVGDSKEMQMHHEAGNNYITQTVGDLVISNSANDKDIQFKSDDGAGNITLYYYLDGSRVVNRFPKNIYLEDNVKLQFGDIGTPDFEIYHNGSHSWISDQGTGNLNILTSSLNINNAADTANMIIATQGGSVNLYYDAAQKFRTVSTGVEVTGQVNLAALNTAPASASAAGTTGEIRVTADYIYVCTATNTWKRAALSTW